MQYEIRPYRADDLSFVYGSWMDNWRESPHAGTVPNHRFYDVTRDLIDGLLARGMAIQVADTGRSLLGFVAHELKDGAAVLHYLYVKDPLHRRGIEGDLLAAVLGDRPGFVTHHTRATAPLLSGPKDTRWKLAPEIARRKTL